MAAYLVGHITVRDEERWSQYVAGVADSLAGVDSKIIFRGMLASVLAGKHEHERVVVIQFADLQTLNNWFHSESYQKLIPLRDSAANVTITTYEE